MAERHPKPRLTAMVSTSIARAQRRKCDSGVLLFDVRRPIASPCLHDSLTTERRVALVSLRPITASLRSLRRGDNRHAAFDDARLLAVRSPARCAEPRRES
jgi:hypothetical protein